MKHILSILLPVLLVSACTRTPQDRTLSFEGIENARELGGLVMQDGRTVRYGKLVRSGELSQASDADVALLQKRFALSDVFDFRFERERSGKPDREIEGVTNTWLSTLPQALLSALSHQFMPPEARGQEDRGINAEPYLQQLKTVGLSCVI